MRVLVAMTAALGVVYGYDASIVGGTLPMLGARFHLDDNGKELVATAAVVGQLVGALASSGLVDRVGRKRSTLLTAIGFVVFSLISALAWDFDALVGARFCVGLVVGVSVVVVPVFVAESAPAARRGALLALYQVAGVTGIILGYLCAWAGSPGHWRVVFAVAAVPALLACVPLALSPTPPRNEPDATRSAPDLRARLAELMRPPYLRAFVFVLGLGAFTQLTGINAVVYYGPSIFEAMGFSGDGALLGLPAFVQFASLISVLVAMTVVDRWGRRPVLITGIVVMVGACLVLAVLFLGHHEQKVRFNHWEAVTGFVALCVFAMGFTFGFGALIWAYAGESFPARLRSLGASALLTADLAANVVISWTFLTVLHGFGGAGTFALLAAVATAALGFVWRLAPETKGRDVEEIEQFWANRTPSKFFRPAKWPSEPTPQPGQKSFDGNPNGGRW